MRGAGISWLIVRPTWANEIVRTEPVGFRGLGCRTNLLRKDRKYGFSRGTT